MTCTRNPVEGNDAWKQCDTHGVFPVWLGHCPGPADVVLNTAVDLLARPYDSLDARQLAQQCVVLMLAGRDPIIKEAS